MKLKKSQLKELIRLSIKEAMWEQEDEEKPKPPVKKDDDDSKIKTDIADNPFDKKEKNDMEEGGKGSGRPAKPGGAKDTENKMMSAADAANAKMDADVKAMKAKKKKKRKKPKGGDVGGPAHPNVKESKVKRFTVKEVRMWMKKLEENRYKKVYNSDARRVSWMVNNEGVEISEMPKSMSKKWTKAQYGRERYLATEFIKSQKVMEQKLRSVIRQVIREEMLNEVKFKKVILPNDMKTKLKVSKMIKQMKLKIDKDYDVKALKARGGDQEILILPKHYNKFIELAMQNKLDPRG